MKQIKQQLLLSSAAFFSILLLAGCGTATTPTSSSETPSQVETSTVSTVSATFTDNLGQIANGIFTAANGSYRITVPQGSTLRTAGTTTTVFSTEDGSTITITSEENTGSYQNLNQEVLEATYRQLYNDYATTAFSAQTINPKRTDYRLSFTGTTSDTTLQVSVCKVVSNQRVITVQISSSSEVANTTDLLEQIVASLSF